MKKIIALVLIGLAISAHNAFGQTTAGEWITKAREYQGKGDYANAITAYSEAIKLDNSIARYYRMRGECYFQIKNYNAAIADCKTALEKNPHFSSANILRGKVYFEIENYNAAIADFTTAIKDDTYDLDAYLFRGFAYYQIKNYDAAIADLDKVIKDAPDFSTGYVVRGDAYGAKGIYHKAVADYRTGLEKGYDTSNFGIDKSSKASMWFLGAMYMEIQVNRFLGKSDAVAKYENWLKTVSDKYKVTRQEIEAFYRDNVRALIAGAVDEEFGKIRFLLENSDTYSRARSHNSVLTRNPQTGQYTLSYAGYYTNDEPRTVKGDTLEALLRAMRTGENKSDFDTTGIRAVQAQAALIPAVVYADWKARGVANGVDGMALVKEALTNFYLNPNDTTYLAAYGIQLRYYALQDTFLTKGVEDIFAIVAKESYNNAVGSLNPALLNKFHKENRFSVAEARRVPNDPRFNIFSTLYSK